MNHYITISLIITGCGLLGGLISFFKEPTEKSTIKHAVAKSLLTGLGASGLVPLFLNTISSDLLATSQTDYGDYFVFGGFCLISAIFSSKFIDSIYDKVMQDIRQVSKKVDEFKEDLDEVTTEKELPTSAEGLYEKVEEEEKAILVSLYRNKYTYRSMSGIAAETHTDKDRIGPLLDNLEAKKYVKKILKQNGHFVRWKLTEKGREIIAEIFGDENSPGFL